MANTTKTYDASDDRSLYTLYRMGFESARVDHTASRVDIRDYWGDDTFAIWMGAEKSEPKRMEREER